MKVWFALACLWLLSHSVNVMAQTYVRDEQHAPVSGAVVRVQSAVGNVLRASNANGGGAFTLPDLPDGDFVLTITAHGFQPLQLPLRVRAGHAELKDIRLTAAAIRETVTATARRGAVASVEHNAQLVSIKDEEALRSRPLATLGNALEGVPGVLVQQSAYGQVSPFLRGLTGYQVLNLIDGVRFNNATFRSGPNQYLAFIEPSQAERVEALLGPISAQYGSDALGGAINVLTATPAFANALSGGDVTDERIGAARRRSDLAAFFRGSLIRSYVRAGNDGAFGTADDVLAATGETLRQIQDRVLPLGATINGVRIADDNSRAPLFLQTAGYATVNLRGSWRLAESVTLNFALMNLFDKNYRTHGSGLDAPGRNGWLALVWRF